MDNTTKIRFELEIQAQRLISEYMLNNAEIEKELELGIKNAFESFNFQDFITEEVKKCIQSVLSSSINYGKIYQAVSSKTNSIIDKYIENTLSNVEIKLKEEIKE